MTRLVRFAAVLAFACALLCTFAPLPGVRRAQAEETARSSADEQSVAQARVRARATQADDDDDDDGGGHVYSRPAGSALGSLFSRRSGLLGTGLMAAAFYFLFMRGRGAPGGSSGGSYYLFWIVAPALIAVASSHPSALLLVVVGLVARRWLPDPYLVFKHRARIRTLQIEVSANPGNVTARRDLAVIWLEKRRPQLALPLVEQALERDPGSLELVYLRGTTQLFLEQPERALESFLTVVHEDPGFRYGEAYLRAADALLALRRLEDAEEALDRHLKINSSSVEALYKLGRVRKARNDAAGVARAQAELRDVWHLLHGFQRRRQFGWYLRARLGR